MLILKVGLRILEWLSSFIQDTYPPNMTMSFTSTQAVEAVNTSNY